MRAVNHVSEGGLGEPNQGRRDRGFCRNGGQTSASGSAPFIISNTVGKTRFQGRLPKRETHILSYTHWLLWEVPLLEKRYGPLKAPDPKVG